MSQQILMEHVFESQDSYCYFTGREKKKNIYIYIYMDICSLSPPMREDSYIQRVLYEVESGACPKVLWQFKKGHGP